jgi:hypothetical protein
MLHHDPKHKTNQSTWLQRILNVLDSVQHLLYFPSAARPRCSIHCEALMQLFGTERSGRKAARSKRVVDGSKDKKRLGKTSRGVRYLQPSASD